MAQKTKKKRNKKMTKKIEYIQSHSSNPLDTGNKHPGQRNTRSVRIHIPRKPSGK